MNNNNNNILKTIGLAIATIFSGIIGINSLALVGQAGLYNVSTSYFMFLVAIDIIALSVSLFLSFKNKKSGALIGLAYAIIGMFTAGVNVGNIGLCVGYTMLTIYNYSSNNDSVEEKSL